MDSVAFLEAFHPRDQWVIVGFAVGGGKPVAKTFSRDTSGSARRWIDRYNGKRNLCFGVNVPKRALTRKASKEDIQSVPWLHVDIDPRAGEPRDEERKRILGLLTEKCPVVPPTVIVDSGNGYQAFWRLTEPVHVGGDTRTIAEIERYTRQLAVVLGGDNCHNVDRVMRLPNTVNIPTASKKKLDRKRTVSEVYLFEKERVYDLSQFTPAPPVGDDAIPPDNVKRIASLDALDQWGVDDRAKAIITHGRHPDEPPKERDDSRSAWLFDAVCQLVRADVPADVIFSIITDRRFKISESVLDKAGRASAYARRQIERAKEETEEPRLARLNDRFFIVGNYGGKCVVVEEYSGRDRVHDSYSIQPREQFAARFGHVHVKVRKQKMPLGRWWLNHPYARRYERIEFAPGVEIDDNTFNLWRGFPVKPSEGDCSLFLDHVRENVAKGHDDWLLNWMARAVQHPGEPGEVAIVLRGARGVGKSFFARQFGALFGSHFLAISNARHLVGHFNSHLEDCVVLLADEAFYAGDRRHASVLKSLVTEPTLAIERKGYDLRQVHNNLHVIMCSNDAWVVPAGLDERRFLVLDVAEDHQRDTVYFGRIAAQMDNGGREALLHCLLTRDIKNWDFRLAPDTTTLTDQKLLSLNPIQRLVYDALCTGAHPRAQVDGNRVFVVTVEWAQESGVTAHALGRELHLFADGQVREVIDGERRRGFWLPPLPEARSRWAAARSLNDLRWPDDVGEWDAVEVPDVF